VEAWLSVDSRTILAALTWFHAQKKSIIVGHRPSNGSLRVNPTGVKLAANDELLIIQGAE
jgi:hypothetical protein